jgi:hypothetical protein
LLTPAQRRLRASVAANIRWSREDPSANAARGQAGLIEKFRREVLKADPSVTEPELSRRAESARKAHMARLALASSKARSRRTGGGLDAA